MKCKVRSGTGISNTCVNGTFKPYEVHKGVERQAWIEKHKERIKRQIRRWLKEKYEE